MIESHEFNDCSENYSKQVQTLHTLFQLMPKDTTGQVIFHDFDM